MIEHTEQAAVETSIINMTPAAAEKVRELITQENDPSLGLRIFVAGGGCSGLQYGMTLDEQQDGDTVIALPGARWKNELTGEDLRQDMVALSALFRHFPVALLIRQEAQ